MIRTNLCPGCKSSERLTPKIVKAVAPELLEKTEEMCLWKFKVPKDADMMKTQVGWEYIDVCARCGLVYCYKYEVESNVK